MSDNGGPLLGVSQADVEALALYRVAAAGLRASLDLGDIAAGHGNGRRSASHLLGALSDLAPELARLAALTS